MLAPLWCSEEEAEGCVGLTAGGPACEPLPSPWGEPPESVQQARP